MSPTDTSSGDKVVLFNILSSNYALWVGSKILVIDNRICFWPYVIETEYGVEYISTEKEFLNRYILIGVL